MNSERLRIKDSEIRRQVRAGKRKNFGKDFFELLKRASKTKYHL